MLGFFRRKQAMSVEAWAQKCSKISTPDRIIAAAIAASIAKDPDDWVYNFSQDNKPFKHYFERRHAPRLENVKKAIVVQFEQLIILRITHCMSYNNYVNVPRMKGTTVTIAGKTFEIDTESAFLLWKAWHGVAKRLKSLKEAEERAITNMKKNEVAWDIVENLLGLRRTEAGALEPVKSVEETAL